MKNKETLEEAAKRCFEEMKILNPRGSIKEFIRMAVNFGAKWQQEQEQNNENSWFNEYQKVEGYIIKRIADKFLEATPEKYNTASEATIALLEDNWEQDENIYTGKQERMYSEEEVLKIIDLLFHKYASSFRVDAKEDFLLSKKK